MDTIEKKKEYNKIWYEKNKEKHLEKMREKMICELCNVEITRSKYSVHEKSLKHRQIKEMKEKIDEIENKKTVNNVLDSLVFIDNNGGMTKIRDLLKPK